MRNRWITIALSLALGWSMAAQESKAAPRLASEDPHLWLEDVTGEKALEWVKARNAEAGKELEGPAFQNLKADLLKIYDSKERIPYVTKHGAFFYNFWQDAKNPRGLWRRATLEEYRKPEPKWDVILDLDALNKTEKENWVWHGAQILKAGGHRHVLITLSRGGADASVTREFDLETRSFVKGGFEIPEAKGGMSWIDKDSVYVSTDFGAGSMTSSGYPRIAKLWRRGTPLSQAATICRAHTATTTHGTMTLSSPDMTSGGPNVPDNRGQSMVSPWGLNLGSHRRCRHRRHCCAFGCLRSRWPHRSTPAPARPQVAKHMEKQQKEREARAMERLHLLLPALGPTVRAVALQQCNWDEEKALTMLRRFQVGCVMLSRN